MRINGEPLNSAGDLADTTDASPFGQWFTGVGMAVLVAIYAAHCLLNQYAVLPSRYRLVEYHGLAATSLGSLYLSIAVFMHLHFFWTASPRYWGYAQLGKLIAAAGMIGSVGLFFFAVLAS
jgi:hypothetical protein